jgi:hypothetical protein
MPPGTTLDCDKGPEGEGVAWSGAIPGIAATSGTADEGAAAISRICM